MPTFPGDSQTPAGRSGPGSYQIPAFGLGPGVCGLLCVSFESGVYFPWGCGGVNPSWALKAKCSGVSSLSARLLGWGAWCGAQNSGFCERNCKKISLHFVAHPPEAVGPDGIVSLPFLPVLLWFLLYVFSCIRLFL